ncbi:MAG: TonB-dependent receptor plug domain-containing protein, partial [Fidelibacterota bacterium]
VVYDHDTYYGFFHDYNLLGFNFSRNGDIPNRFFHNKQQYVGVKAGYQLKYTDHHEIKVGIDWRQHTIRHFDIAPSVMRRINDKNYSFIKTWSSIKEMPADRWQEYGTVDAYGFDIYGNEINKEKKYYDEEGNLLAIAEAPKKPVNFSVYLQDQITYDNLIINAGLRVDYFDADDKILKNPDNPAVMETADFIADEAWKDHGPFLEIQPRFGFSFIPGPKTMFFFQYGKFVQMPEYSQIYSSTPSNMTQQIIQAQNYYKDPAGFGLDPIKSNNFEFGLEQKFNPITTLNITGFYKNTTHLVKTTRTSLPSDRWYIDRYYLRLENGDFALARGVELELVFDRVKRFMGRVNYTYTDAQGIGSNSTSYQTAVYYETALPQTIHPLNFSRKHVGLINLDYRFGQSDGETILSQSGLNLLFKFSSGHPYTRSKAYAGSGELYKLGVYYMDDTRGVTFTEPIGSSTTPWTFTTDLKMDKTFDIGHFRATLYVVINNLFNRKNILNVYEKTGSPDNDGFEKSVKHSAKYYGIQKTLDMYKAINLTNGQSYWDVLDKELWGEPRQIHIGVKFTF